MKLSRLILIITVVNMMGCSKSNSLEGKWEYDGGTYNGKLKKAEPEFKMQRTYTTNSYEAYLIESGAVPVKYGAGTYELKDDTFKVTSTYTSQPSQLLGKTINYHYKIDKNKLTISGTLPNGMQVEEYWKKLE